MLKTFIANNGKTEEGKCVKIPDQHFWMQVLLINEEIIYFLIKMSKLTIMVKMELKPIDFLVVGEAALKSKLLI